ncbi:MAG: tetratricopeptide repeat protein [Tannerella sp.]|jgi:tetratricopeptide (TPR) repeat protein|nr:tetratricopeptide repeat protein [Tannerella sp.]
MRKLIILCFLAAPFTLFAADLTSVQQAKVREVVSQYGKLLSEFASSDAYIGNNEKIERLCANINMSTFDDLKANEQILLGDYLNHIVIDFNHNLSISYEGIQTAKITGYQAPTLDKSESESEAYAFVLIEATKKIKGQGIDKTVKNVFAVNLDDYKIWGISKDALFESDDPYSLLQSGIRYYNNKQYNEALDRFERSAAKGNVEAQKYCGYVHYLQDNYAQAIAAYQKAIELKPDDAEAYYSMGNAYCKQGNYAQAIAVCQKAIELKPDYADAYGSMGTAYYYQGNYAQAIASYQKAIELKPDFAVAYYSMGTAYYYQGNYAQAIAACQKAIELKPDYAEAYGSMGVAYYAQRNYSQAIAAYQKFIELKPDDANVYNYYHSMGTAYVFQNNYAQAIAAYQKAIELKPDIADAYYGMGAAYSIQGNKTQAIAVWKKAARLGDKLAQEDLKKLGKTW